MSINKVNNLEKNYSTLNNKFYSSGLNKYRKKIFTIFLKSFDLKPTTKIVDIGSTEVLEAHENYLLHHYNYKSSLTCFSDQNLEKLKEKFPEINTLRGDGRNMKIQDNFFDIAYSNATIEHVGSYQNQIKFLSELFRVSKKGVFLTTPNRFFPIDLHTFIPIIHMFPKKIHRFILNIFNQKFLAKEENLNLLSKNDLINICKNLEIKNFQIKKIKIFGFTSNLILVIQKTN